VVALIYALSLAGSSTAQAARSNASETNYVNGLPCNDLCNAYMAWSDRIMARSRPSQPQMRGVIDFKRTDRTAHHASGTRRSGSNSFVQLTEPSDAAPQSVEAAHVQAARSEPVQSITEGGFPAAEIVTAKPADAGGATNDSPETKPVSATGFVSANQNTGMISHVARGLDGRFVVELGLALCALLSLLSWWRLRRQAADSEHDLAGSFASPRFPYDPSRITPRSLRLMDASSSDALKDGVPGLRASGSQACQKTRLPRSR
jgi:hypothetical protein